MNHFLFELTEKDYTHLEKGSTIIIERQFKVEETLPKEGDRVGVKNYPGLTARVKSLAPHYEYSEFEVLCVIELAPEKQPKYVFQKLSDLLIALDADVKYHMSESDEFNLTYAKLMHYIKGTYDVVTMSDGEAIALKMLVQQCLATLLMSDHKKTTPDDICCVIEEKFDKVVSVARVERHFSGTTGRDVLVVFPYLPQPRKRTPETDTEKEWEAEALYCGIRTKYCYTSMSWRPTFMDKDCYNGIKTFYPDDNVKFI